MEISKQSFRQSRNIIENPSFRGFGRRQHQIRHGEPERRRYFCQIVAAVEAWSGFQPFFHFAGIRQGNQSKGRCREK